MNELNESFNQYIDELKKLSTEEKRNELIDSVKELIAGFEFLAERDNVKLSYLNNKENLDLNKEFVSEDDFIEAAIVYVEVAKNMIGEYLEKIST